MPNLYLKERTPHLQEKLTNFKPEAINDRGKIVGISPVEQQKFGLYEENKPTNWQQLREELTIDKLEFYNSKIYVVSTCEEKVIVDIFLIEKKQSLSSILSIEFDGLGQLLIKADADNLLIHHSEGRIIMIDKTSNKVLSDYVC